MKGFTSSFFVCVISVIISNPVLAAIENPVIALNSNSNLIQNLTIGSSVKITCTTKPNYVVTDLRVWKDAKWIKQVTNPVDNRITHDINITCKDNAQFRCYGVLNGTGSYSTIITVNIPCPPTPNIIEPIEYVKLSGAANTYGSTFYIRGYPKLTFTGMKVTPQGPVNLSLAVQLQPQTTTGFRLYFRNYTENEYGTYLIKAENIHGVFTANLTYRGLIANPTNLVAWSTSPNSIHLRFRAGETFNVAVTYTIIYKINDETSVKSRTVTDVGDAITVTLNSLKPETTYNIVVQARYPKFGNSLYSNIATVTTIKQGDSPQQEPVNTLPPTTPLTSFASPVGSTSTKHSTSSTSPTGPTVDTGGPEDLGFVAGIGIGLGVGILVAVTAVIVTILCFKRTTKTKVKDTSLQQYPPGEAMTNVKDTTLQQYPPEEEEMYENIPGDMQHNYEALTHKDPGARYNAAYNRH